MKQPDSVEIGKPDSLTNVASHLHHSISQLLSTAIPALMLVLSGCAGAAGSQMRTSPSQDVLSRREIAGLLSATTAYEAVQLVRPQWFRTRGAQSMYLATPIQVHVDGMERGNIGALRMIPTSVIADITFVSARDATIRWGTGHRSAVIEVTTLNARHDWFDPHQS